MGTLVNGGTIDSALKNGIIGGLFGAVSAGLTYGVAEVFGHGTGMLGSKAFAHGLVSSFMTRARGGKWNSGFWSGFAGTLLSPVTNMARGYYAKVAANAMVAGTVSVISGGKFANGAFSGAFRFMFNDWLHDTWNSVKQVGLEYGSRIVGGIGGALQVTAGGILIYTGAGAPLGTLMVMQGANNVQEAITGTDGYLRKSYDFWFGNNADYAYAAVDVGSSVTGLMRQVGLKSTTLWSRNFGSVEYVRPMYEFETMNKGALLFETVNNINTIYSNTGH